jgi:hypothetical protein
MNFPFLEKTFLFIVYASAPTHHSYYRDHRFHFCSAFVAFLCRLFRVIFVLSFCNLFGYNLRFAAVPSNADQDIKKGGYLSTVLDALSSCLKWPFLSPVALQSPPVLSEKPLRSSLGGSGTVLLSHQEQFITSGKPPKMDAITGSPSTQKSSPDYASDECGPSRYDNGYSEDSLHYLANKFPDGKIALSELRYRGKDVPKI